MIFKHYFFFIITIISPPKTVDIGADFTNRALIVFALKMMPLIIKTLATKKSLKITLSCSVNHDVVCAAIDRKKRKYWVIPHSGSLQFDGPVFVYFTSKNPLRYILSYIV